MSDSIIAAMLLRHAFSFQVAEGSHLAASFWEAAKDEVTVAADAIKTGRWVRGN